MSLENQIIQAMALVAEGMEDEGEWKTVEEIKITYEVKKYGDFEIIVRRPENYTKDTGK